MMKEETEVAIIGAGPAGAIVSALLTRIGHKVVVLEKSQFPRFSIGESLLPQCMEFIADAGMIGQVDAEGFQHKNGAVFVCGGEHSSFDFRHKYSAGPGTTYQVQRGRFDQVLADSAAEQGVDIRYGCGVVAITTEQSGSSTLSVIDANNQQSQLQAQFVLDASGFGRVLPRLLGLERPSDFPVRKSVFTHISDNIADPDYDRDKIIIAIHPDHREVWYWLIPFSKGRCSIGVVAKPEFYQLFPDASVEDILRQAVEGSPDLSRLLKKAVWDTPVQSITGYSCNVTSLWGNGFALLGNAGEFLDPVFSSGVTVAMKSASLAAPLVSRQLKGEAVNWEVEYAQPLMVGVDTFRAYVNGWYDGSLQQVIFAQEQTESIREMICSILAGYAWDTSNPFVREPKKYLKALAELCATGS